MNNNDHLGLNSGVYDVATLTPANGNGFPYTGTVTFKFFTTIDCTGTAASEPGVAVSGNTAQSSNHLTLAAGNYSFNAQYIAGSDNNHANSAVSGCEPFVINPATPSADTTLHNAAGGAVVNNNDHLGLNSGVYDVATLTPANGNGFPYTGTVTFKFFTTIDCTGTAASEPGVAVSGNTARPRTT